MWWKERRPSSVGRSGEGEEAFGKVLTSSCLVARGSYNTYAYLYLFYHIHQRSQATVIQLSAPEHIRVEEGNFSPGRSWKSSNLAQEAIKGQSTCIVNVTWIQSTFIGLSPDPKYKILTRPSISFFYSCSSLKCSSKILRYSSHQEVSSVPSSLESGWALWLRDPERIGKWGGVVSAVGHDRQCASASTMGTRVREALGSRDSVWQPRHHQAVRKPSHTERSHGATLVTRHMSEKSPRPSTESSRPFKSSRPEQSQPSPAVPWLLALSLLMGVRKWLLQQLSFEVICYTAVISGTILLLHPHLWSFSVEASIFTSLKESFLFVCTQKLFVQVKISA